MDSAHQNLVAAQFGARAAAYVESAVHAQGADLDDLEANLRARPAARLLDLGCGGGHLSLRAAPLVKSVTAFDLAEPMLAAVEQAAAQRGLANVSTRRGTAEALPFSAASFDVVASRYSAHHWNDLVAALREVRRVLASGGRALFMDVVAPGSPLLDTYLQTVELLRDPSHVRDYSAAEWTRALETAGLRIDSFKRRRLRLDFSTWVARIGTPEPFAAAIRALQGTLATEVRDYFAFEADGSFTVDAATFEASC